MTFATATSRFDSPVDEAMIEGLVRRFYGRVRADPELGPIFESVIGDDWEPHLRIMMEFWSSLMLRSGRYSGQPLRKHLALKQVRPEHFDRWLALFRETCAEIGNERVGAAFIDKAERIAESFKLGMFFHPAQVAPR